MGRKRAHYGGAMVKHSFLVAGIITFVVFTAGMFVQWNLDQLRTDQVVQSINQLSLTTNSVFTEKELTSLFKEDECVAYQERLSTIADDVGRIGSALEKYQDRSLFSENKYNELKHEYHILEIFYWSRLLQIKELCQNNDFVTILYFYQDNDKCSECQDQGIVLTSLKKTYEDKVQIFAIDADMASKETTVKFLTDIYKVSSTPVIVIDKNGRFPDGFVSKDELENAVNVRLGR